MILDLHEERRPPTFAPGRCAGLRISLLEDRAPNRSGEPRWLGWLLVAGLVLWMHLLLRGIDIAIFRAAGR